MNHKKKFFVIENETRTAVFAFYNGSEHLTDVFGQGRLSGTSHWPRIGR